MTIALDVGGTNLRVARLAGTEPPPSSDVLIRPTPPDLEEMAEAIVAAIEHPDRIGVGCAGIVDDGVVRWMPHATGRELPLRDLLTERFGVPVVIDNDANMAALAEARHGAGAGERMVLMVTVGTGIGVGLVIDGRVERGRSALGEAGHMRLAPGPECSCGEAGCWEALVSGRVMDAAARRLLGDGHDGTDLVVAADAGDAAARAALDEAGEWLGIGLGNLILTLDPDVVVLGGGAMRAGNALLAPASRYLGARRGVLAVTGIPPIRTARFGTSAGLIGAAIAAREV